ncbi:MAG: hypothetical protein AB7R55_12485 [Gemmatimonadales bacterium]
MRGIGVVTGVSADASFRLDPGKARTATFAVRFQAGRRQVGTRYAFDATIAELELLPSNQVRTVREHALGFRDVTPGVWSASPVVEGLLNRLIGGAKKP